MGQRRVLRELPRTSRTAQRETEGRNARTVTELAVIIHPSFSVGSDLRAETSGVYVLGGGQVADRLLFGLVEQ